MPIDLYHEVHGSGPAVLLLSGLAADISSWALQVGPLAAHHTVTLSAGVSLASGAVMDERYAVSFTAGGARDYRPAGGVTSIDAGINWNWALSSKWLLNSAMTGTRLGSGPAHSPFIERRNVITWSSGLGYRF